MNLFLKRLRCRIRRRLRRGSVRLPYLDIQSPVLRDFFRKAELSLLDVGARGGPYPQLAMLAPFADLYLCEPDEKEAHGLKENLEKKWKRVEIITSALGTKTGHATLHLTRSSGLSSLFQPNQEIIGQFFNSAGMTDNEPKKGSREIWDVVDSKRVPVEALDDVCRRYGNVFDFIKLDTQGTELDILLSGKDRAMPGALALVVEAEFLPFYEGQPLFGDVEAYLTKEGFCLLDMKRTLLRRGGLKKKPVYSRREITWAHTFWVRERNRDGSVLTPLQMHRLACLTATFWYFDYALWLLASSSMQSYLQNAGFEGVDDELLRYASEVGKEYAKGFGRKEHWEQGLVVWQDG